jgi:predicted Rossmann fold flavoprotein
VTAPPPHADIAVIGAGAAGLATAIFAARARPDARIVAFDGAKKPGAKILVSGGGRCNVTNACVEPADFYGGNPHIIRRILRAFTADDAVAFFRELDVSLHEEPLGKLFPDSNSAKTVLAALLDEADRRSVTLLADHRVTTLQAAASGTPGFRIETSRGEWTAAAVVLATGGLSLPKTGSDGHGLTLARCLGHTLVPTTPGLAPLTLGGDFHAPLSGISHDVELTIRAAGDKPVRIRGALLWTHFGISGPVVLNASRFWHRARLEDRDVILTANLLPDHRFETAERDLLDAAGRQPKSNVVSLLAARLPARVAEAVVIHVGLRPHTPLAHLAREDRRRLLHALLEFPIPVTGSRGYAYAEVTAGGVPLDEIDPATMASRRCRGLFLVGEILDADARIGGFNFQWAWSTAFVAARGLRANQ